MVERKDIIVISLGAGVQSTAMLLLSLRGELPRADHVIFADTQWEPASVYRHLEWLKEECAAAGIPLHVVTKGSLKYGATDVRISKKSGNSYVKVNLPVWVRSGEKIGLNSKRQCTADYKLAPIYSFVWNKIINRNRNRRVKMWMGISWDERSRLTASKRKYCDNVYPFCGFYGDGLLPKPWTRTDCVAWLELNYPDRIVPRSACVVCPYHQNKEWRRLRDEEPAEFARAIADEKDIQAAWDEATALDGKPFLHRSGVQLSEADLSDNSDSNRLVFGMVNECEGMCGV